MLEFPLRSPTGLVATESQTKVTTMLRIVLFLLLLANLGFAQKPSFTVGWSVYAGWTPYYYMNKSGLLRKWADKYGIAIKVQRTTLSPTFMRAPATCWS